MGATRYGRAARPVLAVPGRGRRVFPWMGPREGRRGPCWPSRPRFRNKNRPSVGEIHLRLRNVVSEPPARTTLAAASSLSGTRSFVPHLSPPPSSAVRAGRVRRAGDPSVSGEVCILRGTVRQRSSLSGIVRARSSILHLLPCGLQSKMTTDDRAFFCTEWHFSPRTLPARRRPG